MGDTERLGGKTRVPDLPDSGIVFSSGCSVAAVLGVHRRTLRYWSGGNEPREPGDYLTLTLPGEDTAPSGEGEGMEDVEGDLGPVPGVPALLSSSDQEVGNATYKQ